MDWGDEVEWGQPEVTRDRNVSVMLHNLTCSFNRSWDLLEWAPNQPQFDPDDLAGALWGSLSVIETLSMHGLLNHAFKSGTVPGAFQSQCLLILWRVLGQYYPSVLPTDDDLCTPCSGGGCYYSPSAHQVPEAAAAPC
jgi:hypothetical protein